MENFLIDIRSNPVFERRDKDVGGVQLSNFW
jgi:hypothetical protein